MVRYRKIIYQYPDFDAERHFARAESYLIHTIERTRNDEQEIKLLKKLRKDRKIERAAETFFNLPKLSCHHLRIALPTRTVMLHYLTKPAFRRALRTGRLEVISLIKGEKTLGSSIILPATENSPKQVWHAILNNGHL